MMNVIYISPFRCRVWRLHPRLDDLITEKDCDAEVKSFEACGQLVPALGRRLRGDREYDVEIISGARRLFVARHLNVPLEVELREMADRDAIVAMDLDNRQRKDISPYERGMSYARWLREGYFKTQEELASAVHIATSQVSRLLRLAALPREVVAAFGRAGDICEAWGVVLAESLADAGTREALIERSRQLSAEVPRRSAREIQKELYAVASRLSARLGHERQVVRATDGVPLFEIKRQNRAVLVVLPVRDVSSSSLKEIEEVVARIIQTPQRVDTEAQRAVTGAAASETGPKPLEGDTEMVGVERMSLGAMVKK